MLQTDLVSGWGFAFEKKTNRVEPGQLFVSDKARLFCVLKSGHYSHPLKGAKQMHRCNSRYLPFRLSKPETQQIKNCQGPIYSAGWKVSTNHYIHTMSKQWLEMKWILIDLIGAQHWWRNQL